MNTNNTPIFGSDTYHEDYGGRPYKKKEGSNLKPDAVRMYKKAAKEIFRQTDEEIDKLIKGGVFIPVKCHEKDQDL